VKVDETYDIARENHNPMEPHATVAAWNGDRLTLWSKSQFVVNEQAEIAAIFGIPVENVQVICPFIGGAFGTSLRTWPHVTLAAMAARQVGRPVKLVLTRKQMFLTTGHRPRTLQRVALGAMSDGKLTGLVHEGSGETSRYEQFIEALTNASSFMYACPNVRTRYRLRPLDISTPNHMRGPGEASGIFALRARHRSDRPATPQRADDRRGRGQALLQPFADEVLRPRRRALRVVAPDSRATVHARWQAAHRHGCRIGLLSGLPRARRHRADRGRGERHGPRDLHVDDPGRG
jgi:hypothetical protein